LTLREARSAELASAKPVSRFRVARSEFSSFVVWVNSQNSLRATRNRETGFAEANSADRASPTLKPPQGELRTVNPADSSIAHS
jgi:hypothetical protein